MKYRLQDLIDIKHFQNLQDRLNTIYSFPSSIIDNEGNILTATAWQDVCTKFHRKNKETEQLCIKSDQYISDHIHEAKPAISYRCPHGLMDNATPIIIDGIHYGNFFTGQFFLEKPDLELFRTQAQKYGFDEQAYIAAVNKVPVWTQEQLNNYLFFIKGLITVISESGMKKLKEIEHRKQIQKNEKRYRSILKAAIDGYWLTDTKGRLLEVNDAYCRMSGYNEEELLNMHISELEFVETPEIIAEHMKLVVTKGSDRFETRHRRKDGSVFDVEVSIQFPPEDGGQCVCFLRDITDRKRAEKALKESEERYNLAMDASRDGVYEWDLETREIYYSPGWKRMLGYEPDELPDDFSVWEKLTRPEDVEKSWQIMNEVAEGKRERFEVEFQMRHKDGHWIHILSRSNIYKDGNGKPVRVVGTHVDITDSIYQRERLRLSESRYRKAQELGKVGNWEYNLKTTEFWGSDEAKKIFELDPYKNSFTIEEVEGCIIERERVHQALVDLIENRKPYNLEYDIITKKTGERKTFVSMAEIETDAAKNPVKVSGVIHDITERKQAEEALQEKTKFLQNIIDTTSDLVAVTDMEGNFKFIGPAHRFLGYNPDSLIGRNVMEFVHPDDYQETATAFAEFLANREDGRKVEYRYRRVDGDYLWFETVGKFILDDAGNPKEILFSSRDFTAHKKAEAQIESAQDQFQSLVNNIPGIVYRCKLDKDWTMLFMSDAIDTLSGYPASDFIGNAVRTYESIIHPDDTDYVAQNVHSAFAEGRSWNIEYRICHKEGDIRWVQEKGREISGEDCSAASLDGFILDITDRRQAEFQREKLQEQLNQAQKMESVGRLAGGVAHDFNNMLGVILGNIELTRDSKLLDDELDEQLAEAQQAARQSAELTTQLLAFSRLQHSQPVRVSADQHIESSLRILRRMVGASTVLSWQPGAPGGNLLLDPAQFDQILMNLVLNARDAMEERGTITISTRIGLLPSTLHDPDRPDTTSSQYVCIAVEDEGAGMDKETQSHVFEPFFTTKLLGHGTGLGLATVYGIVKQSLGFITLKSEQGKGSQFDIYFPILEDEESQPQLDPEHAYEMAVKDQTILIVEDEEMVARVTRRVLEKGGYSVCVAHHADEALALLQLENCRPSLMITDILMPGLNGVQLAEQIQRKLPNLPILYISGHDRKILDSKQVEHFLPKPFTSAALLNKVTGILSTR